jgi:hypothetical protein
MRLTRTSKCDRDKVIENILFSIDSPRSLSVWLLYSNNEHEQLLSIPDIDFSIYPWVDHESLSKDYQATRLLSKAKFLSTRIDKRKIAMEKEIDAEDLCRSTNNFFRIPSTELHALRSSSRLAKTRRYIARVLGDFDSFMSRVDGGHLDPGWTPGRNTLSFGNELSASEKFSKHIECTPASAGFVLKTIQRSPLWGQSALSADGPCSILFRGLSFTEGNVLTTVPKNSKTDRVICYEPNGNIWVQKIAGDYIRHRLAGFGCDLSDQSTNASLAKIGSRLHSFATIDLSSASDTLAIEVVFELLPLRWASFLNNLRSRSHV